MEQIKWKLRYYNKSQKFLNSPEYERYQRLLAYAQAGRYDLILEERKNEISNL